MDTIQQTPQEVREAYRLTLQRIVDRTALLNTEHELALREGNAGKARALRRQHQALMEFLSPSRRFLAVLGVDAPVPIAATTQGMVLSSSSGASRRRKKQTNGHDVSETAGAHKPGLDEPPVNPLLLQYDE